MNQCKYTSYLADYLEQELDSHLKRQVEEHLPHCSVCKKELENLKFFNQVSGSLDEEELPDGLHERIMEKVRSVHRSRNKHNWLRHSLIPVAAVLMFIFLSQGVPDIISRRSSNGKIPVPVEDMIMATPGQALGFIPDISDEVGLDVSGADVEPKETVDQGKGASEKADNLESNGTDESIDQEAGERVLSDMQGETVKDTKSELNETKGDYSPAKYIFYGVAICLSIVLILYVKNLLKRKSEA